MIDWTKYRLVPVELPHEVLGEAAMSGVFETGNPKHGWDFLLAKVGIAVDGDGLPSNRKAIS